MKLPERKECNFRVCLYIEDIRADTGPRLVKYFSNCVDDTLCDITERYPDSERAVRLGSQSGADSIRDPFSEFAEKYRVMKGLPLIRTGDPTCDITRRYLVDAIGRPGVSWNGHPFSEFAERL